MRNIKVINMTWKDILKDDMKRVRDKDRRRNPKERDEVDIESKPKKMPEKPKTPFNPFDPDAGKRARASKKLREERAKREKDDSLMDTEPSEMGKLIEEQRRLARQLKEQRAKEGKKSSDEDDGLLTREQRIARIKALKRGNVKSPRMGVEGGTKGRGSKRYGKEDTFRGQ